MHREEDSFHIFLLFIDMKQAICQQMSKSIYLYNAERILFVDKYITHQCDQMLKYR